MSCCQTYFIKKNVNAHTSENVDQFLHTILCASPFFCKFQILYYMS